MKIFSSKKRVAAIGVVTAATLVGGGMAYAYFTASGIGTGTATVGTSTAWDVAVDLADNTPALLPDEAIGTGNIQTRDYTVSNLGDGNQQLTQVVVSVKTSTGGLWTYSTGAGPACTADDFSIGGETPGSDHIDVDLAGLFGPAGSLTDAATDTVTVQMIDNDDDQDNCKGAPVPLYFSAS